MNESCKSSIGTSKPDGPSTFALTSPTGTSLSGPCAATMTRAAHFDRRRHKWICAHSCRNGATPAVYIEGTIYPPEECPYLDHPHGQIVNVDERFKNTSSIRLVPVGTRAWNRLYHRARNAVEGRNATFQAWGLKRLPLYGNPRNKALIFQADVWLNLSTMARLVLEATAATSST